MNTLWLAGNRIGEDGAKAVAAALEPRKNPDDSWVYNGALEKLWLQGGCPPSLVSLPHHCDK